MTLDPLHQFELHRLIPLVIGGLDFSFTNSSLFMVLSLCVPLLITVILLRRGGTLVPNRGQALLEIPYKFIMDMLEETNGTKGRPFFSLIFSLFIFILCANMLGMVPYAFTITSHIAVTFALSGLIFILITGVGLWHHGWHFLSLFCPKGVPLWLMPLLIPIEILSYLSRPVSLAVRLFANMMAGHTMMKVFAGFTVMLGLGGIAPLMINVLLTGFEVLVAFLQAYVFTILCCLYLHDALELH
jgi:F-type H+-transporting ATPase subunit a